MFILSKFVFKVFSNDWLTNDFVILFVNSKGDLQAIFGAYFYRSLSVNSGLLFTSIEAKSFNCCNFN